MTLWPLYPLCLDRVCFLVPKPNLGLVLVPFHVCGVHGWVARPLSAHSQAVWIQCAFGLHKRQEVWLHVIPWRAEVFWASRKLRFPRRPKRAKKMVANLPKMGKNLHCEVPVTYRLGLKNFLQGIESSLMEEWKCLFHVTCACDDKTDEK